MDSDASLSIVIIDDSIDTAESLGELLESEGHRVSIAADGNSGMDTVLREHPDVALIDLELPGLHGLEVAHRLRAQASASGTFLVAFSGHGGARKQARQAGFDAFLDKPFPLDRLQTMLKDVARQR